MQTDIVNIPAVTVILPTDQIPVYNVSGGVSTAKKIVGANLLVLVGRSTLPVSTIISALSAFDPGSVSIPGATDGDTVTVTAQAALFTSSGTQLISLNAYVSGDGLVDALIVNNDPVSSANINATLFITVTR